MVTGMTTSPRAAGCRSSRLFSVSLIVLGVWVCGALAQTPTTMRDIVAAGRLAAFESDLRTINPTAANQLDWHLTLLERSVPPESQTLAHLARWRQPEFAETAHVSGLQVSLGIVRDIVNNDVAPLLDETTSAAYTDSVLAPFDQLHVVLLEQSLAESLERIRRYEVKFGPRSARLNLIEVGLNYGFQWFPGFGPNDAGDPGPLEVIAAYSSYYLTTDEDDPTVVSSAEAGLRFYFFGESWGGDGWAGYFKPNHASAGLLVANRSDGALQSPFADEPRFGAFLGWGGLKVGYLLGDESRIIVSREVQFVPWLF